MATSSVSLHRLFLLLLIISFNYGGNMKAAKGLEYEKTWCVAKPSASEAELQSNIEYACNNLGDYCKMIESGGSCYEPNSIMNHASAVMNQYYASVGRNYWNCDFRGSSIVVVTDPSYGSCKYE
ncbi:hypothetical protein K1719_002037 [Acacia pycnantha]|nr:hypothetical protein K1719_002037 [Acacia pycnantha]